MDYAQARLQARFGERPDESLWQKLEAAPETTAALAIARSCGLRRWVAGIAPDADSHAVEIALRACWRECVSEASSWMPGNWRPAMLWTGGLADLPALSHLARGGAPLPWMLRDPLLHAYAQADSKAREAMLAEQFQPLLKSARNELGQSSASSGSMSSAHIRDAWLDEWRRRWPEHGDTSSLDDLVRLLGSAMRRPVTEGRQDLTRGLRRLFRRSVLAPVAAFIYIAFVALDIERLRAGLLRHALARERILAS